MRGNPIEIDQTFMENPAAWLEKWLAEDGRPALPYLLAHTDDGVVWGFVDDGKLRLPNRHQWQLLGQQAALSGAILLQLRLFGPEGELFIWRAEDGGFNGRFLADGRTPPEDSYETRQILWGEGAESNEHFTLMREGEQELFHTPPLPRGRGKRGRLRLRHYLAWDDRGQAYVALSRLVDLEAI